MRAFIQNFPLWIFTVCSSVLLFGGCIYHKNNTKNFPDKLWIYSYSHDGGLIRGDVRDELFDIAERKDTMHIADVAILNKVIKWAKVKKSAPVGKLDAEAKYLFCGARIGHKYHRILICDDNLIIDFTAGKDYMVTQAQDKEWLMNLHNNKKSGSIAYASIR